MQKKYICISDTAYSLALYLLLMSMDDINKTDFLLGNTINRKIKEKLPLVHDIPSRWDWKTSFVCNRKSFWSYINGSTRHVYAQDHINYADALIGKNKYTLLEDAPGCYSQLDSVTFLTPREQNKGKNLKQRIKYYLAHTPIYGKTFGTNEQCVCRLVSDPRDINSPYIKGKNYQLVSLPDLWKNSDEEKKEFILNVFSISTKSIVESSTSELLILTQPFMEDCQLTEEEMVNLYQSYIERFKNVAIKVHPRDHFDYLKYFPQVKILDNNAPMQLLNIVGMNFSTALTVCSTALSAMPETTKRIYLGTNINPKIRNVYGDLCNE